LYPRLPSQRTLCFGAEEVMNFLWRKPTGHLQGEIVSDLSSLACRRVGGSRIEHRARQNRLKMYDKAGLVLRVERYEKARRGELRNFTGIDSPCEPPKAPEPRIDTTEHTAERAANRVTGLLRERGIIL
jgi:hypothetical protein